LAKQCSIPESVGRTKNGRAGATYLILNNDDSVYWYEFVFVEYDVKKTIEKIVNAKLPVEPCLPVLALGQTFDMGISKVQQVTTESMSNV